MARVGPAPCDLRLLVDGGIDQMGHILQSGQRGVAGIAVQQVESDETGVAVEIR